MIRVNTTVNIEMSDVVEAVTDDVNDAAEFLEDFVDSWTETGWGNLARALSDQAADDIVKRDFKRLGELLIEAGK